MLSPGYYNYRWSWYRPFIQRGDAPKARCKVDVRRLPIKITGEDASEYIPYGVESHLSKVFPTAIRRLYDLSVRYMIEGAKVSAHQLPKLNPVSRSMVDDLQSHYPHFPRIMLHHWCAEESSGLALLETWQNMWRQSWKQEKADNAPWVTSVNILMLKMMRQAIMHLPSEHGAHTDHVMGCVIGGLYDWALRRFLKQHVDGAVEVTRIATYEGMVIPVTPMTFLYRQPGDSLLADDRFVVLAYGLEPDIIPRMRELRIKVGPDHENGITALLAKDKMGEHFLKRSWARLALWDMAEQTGQGVWMQWVLDAKKLDQLLARPEQLPASVFVHLKGVNHPVATWLTQSKDGKGSSIKPWLKDDRVLAAFRCFEEDVKVEIERRKAETRWMDYQTTFTKKLRGSECDRALEKSWNEGEIVYFRQDPELSLHVGTSLRVKQGCLRIVWSDYLAMVSSQHADFDQFMRKTFLPKISARATNVDHLFLDNCSVSGCLLRGASQALVEFALDIRTMLKTWYDELGKESERNLPEMPTLPMCMTLVGDWDVIRYRDEVLGNLQMGVGSALVQAEAAVAHDAGTLKLIDWYDTKAGVIPLGKVRVGKLAVSSTEQYTVLSNQGFAMTFSAMKDYSEAMKKRARVREFQLDLKSAGSIMSTFRVPSKSFTLVAIMPNHDEKVVHMMVQAGRVILAGVETELYEFLEPGTEAYEMILRDVLASWAQH